MSQQVAQSVENNFTKGLITEFTGLNFPENAATETFNCEYTDTGEVKRRLGIDLEENFTSLNIASNQAISSYKWNGAGGDSLTQIVVTQVGSVLRFYRSSTATVSSPLSTQLLESTIDMTSFVPSGGSFDSLEECTYADGNGYLFVFNSTCDPLYCTYDNGVVSASAITVKVRDFLGVPELDVAVDTRPTVLTASHSYNLSNQGWTSGEAWSGTTSGGDGVILSGTGSTTFNVGTVVGITLGDTVYGYSQAVYYDGGVLKYPSGTNVFGGTVTAYSAPNITINITSMSNPGTGPFQYSITQTNVGFVSAWLASQGNYPSNADVWWYFKNASGVFDPSTTQPNISLSAGNAPQGHFILPAFNQDRGAVSGVSGLTSITTPKRPSNGCWFQGRVWYTGVDASQQASGTAPFYSWSENIYFSQVNVGTNVNFGNCYQTNDPTSENLLDILPTDGGVIQIQSSGKIYKLFPIQNGLIVFAANGIWFITGSQGIGFAANDYTITRLSSIGSISSTSFVDVTGLPFFWNEEGIYTVKPQQQGGLGVESITVGSIRTFYDEIPLSSKKYARGVYHPIDWTIQWVYRSEEETGIANRYKFDRILNFSTFKQAFFPYSIDNNINSIASIVYVQNPGGTNAPDPMIKYFCFSSEGSNPGFSFAEEWNEDYTDWVLTGNPVDYTSYFITGYKLRGKGIQKFQPQYIQMWSRVRPLSGYRIRGIWDYATNSTAGRYTQFQTIEVTDTNYRNMYRRHKIRGHGYSLQLQVNSISGKPFEIIGWAAIDTINAGT
jgi:hypothetical protein